MALPARVAVLVVFVLACGTALADARPAPRTGCRDKTLVPDGTNAARVRAATICLVNTRRRGHGLPLLRANADLRRVAQRHSGLMVRQRFFEHTAPDGSTLDARVERTAYLDRAQSWALGENLAWGEGADATALATVRKWMASSYHRPQVLHRRYRDVGVGISRGAPLPIDASGATYSVVFGRRSPR